MALLVRRQKPTGRIAYHPRPYALRRRSGLVGRDVVFESLAVMPNRERGIKNRSKKS